MRQFLKRLFAIVTLTVVTQSSFVSAAGIRVIGPSGRVQDAPEYNLPMNQEPSQFYGPTTANETLWSIASKLRPSDQVTVQQTLLAIFELNPSVFENQNIHRLIPGSRIRVPSLLQVQSVTTEQAVAVMKVHQARLDREVAAKVARSTPKAVSKPAPVTPPVVQENKTDTHPQDKPITPPVIKEPNAENSLQSKLAEISKPAPIATTFNAAEQENILALEEKNHRLMLMLSKVQSEVDNLKSNLDDQTRIRSEVEKLLIEEKRKNEEAARLAPSTFDNLLSQWWFIGGVGLIPGALIAYLITLFIRRSGGKDEAVEEAATVQEQPESLNVGDISSDSVDDLMLDDDLFSVDDNEDSDDVNTDDVFAELDDSDLSISLDDENGEEDPFAAVDDDGDFIGIDIDDTISTESSNGISVNADDKAIGLEEMEKALDEVANNLDDDFDLSDDVEENDNDIISQNDIESLLAGAEELDNLDADSSDREEQETGEFSGMGLGNASIASDSDIENLFSSIESQVDLDDLENRAISEEDYNLDSDDDDADLSLLDELVDAEVDTEEDTDWDKELDELSGFDLSSDDDLEDDFLTSSPESLLDEHPDIIDSEEVSSEELDDLFDNLNGDEENLDLAADPELSSEPLDDGTEFLDELIEIEKSAPQGNDSESTQDSELSAFNSDDFLDDLLDSVPENDPLLDDMDLDGEGAAEEFDFNPEIEGHDSEENSESEIIEPEELEELQGSPAPEMPEEVQANEFGIPQDDDWDIEGESLEAEVAEEPTEEPLELDDSELPEFSEEDLFAEAEAPEEIAEEQAEELPLQPEMEEEPAEEPHSSIADEELFEELVALADSSSPETEPEEELTESELVVSKDETPPEEEISQEQTQDEVTEVTSDEEPQSPTADDELLDEFVALAEPLSEIEEPEEDILDEEISLDDMSEPDFVDEDILSEGDFEEEPLDEQLQDSELPEFNEEDAFNSYDDAEEETEVLASADEQTERLEIDEDDLPSFNEDELLGSQTAPDTDVIDTFSEPENDEETVSRAAFDEKALDELLSDDDSAEPYSLSATIDDDFVDSAGMNIDTMLQDLDGEDWNGFKLSPEQQNNISVDIPDDEQDIWREDIQTAEPELEDENWSIQENVVDDDPKDKRYMTIDELMAQVDADGGEFEEQDLKLDVGLNEFPDVIGNIGDIDVDSNAEATGKLDLAKIYIEMNDDQGAIKLLEEAIVDGDDNIRRQAKHLIDQINGERS